MRVLHFFTITLVAVSLTGCSSEPARQIVPTEAAQAMMFDSEDEALGAAAETYRQYLAISDQIARDGGSSPERIGLYVSPSLLADELEGFRQISEGNLVAVGSSTFEFKGVQKFSGSKIAVYVCIDHTEISLFDQRGNSLTNETRIDRIPLVVTFNLEIDSQIQITSSESWSGQNFC